MRNKLYFCFIFFLIIISSNLVFAKKKIYRELPEDMELQPINKDIKNKIINSEIIDSGLIENQYKGKLKKRKKSEIATLYGKKYLFYINGGANIFISGNNSSSTFFPNTDKSIFEKIQPIWNVSAGFGLTEGFKVEVEYAQSTTGNIMDYKINAVYDKISKNKLHFYMINFIFDDFKYEGNVFPYIGFGGGLLHNNYTIQTKEDGLLLDKVVETSFHSIRPAVQAMLGINFILHEKFNLTLYYKYFNAFDFEFMNNPLEFKKITSNHSINLNFRFIFYSFGK